jgi:hypothetical protein
MNGLGNRRGLWVFLFLITGLPALFSVLAATSDPRGALPWVVLTWAVLAVSGYRIWRIDHPYQSAQRQLARGGYLFVTWTAGLILVLLIQAEPLLVLVPLAAWTLLMVLLGIVLWALGRSSANG